jgi:hypothetical protein
MDSQRLIIFFLKLLCEGYLYSISTTLLPTHSLKVPVYAVC